MKACSKVMNDKICSLSDLWRCCSQQPYESSKAKRTLQQIPVAIFGSGTGRSGKDLLMVSISPKQDREFYEMSLVKLQEKKNLKKKVNHRLFMKDLLLVAESEAERERLKYAAITLTQTSRREAASNLGVSKSRLRNRER